MFAHCFVDFASLEEIGVQFKEGPIQGVVVRELTKHSDPRGWLTELFRRDEIVEGSMPVMSYVSATEPESVRGPHEHRHQSDFFCLVGPSTFRFYLWDTRRESPTYLHKTTIDAGKDLPRSIIIPAGVVHAYKNTGTDEGWVLNFPNRLYGGTGRGEAIDEVRHENDPNSPFILD